jgi:hypothetical protein
MTDSVPQMPLSAIERALEDGRLQSAVHRREHGAALDIARRALGRHGGLADRLEHLHRVLPRLLEHLDEHERSELRSKLLMLRNESQPLAGETTTDVLEASGRRLSVIDGLTQDVETLILRAWRGRIRMEFSNLGRLGDILQKLRIQTELGRRMESIAREGLGLENDFPPDADAMDTLDSRIRMRDQTLAELSSSGLGISSFLLRVAEGRATLADLGGETLDWLRLQNALDRFDVRLT